MLDLVKNNWILIFASALNLLQYVVLVEVNKKNLAVHGCIVGKKKILTDSLKRPQGLPASLLGPHFENH